MDKEIVGEVTVEEKNEILILFERKLGIEELEATLESDLLTNEKKEYIKSKMTSELYKVRQNLQAWWNKMHEKYHWKSVAGCRWNIDFQTCEIYLTK